MTHPLTRTLAAALLCGALVALSSCKDTPAAASASGAEAPKLKVKTEAGDEALSIRQTDRGVKLKYPGGALKSRPKNDQKTAYEDAAGAVRYVVKVKGAGFKVEAPGGALLAKVKKGDDKWKVSAHEDNRDALELVLRGDVASKVKVRRGDVELGQVRYDAATQKLRVKDAAGGARFKATADALYAAFGVLLDDRLDEGARRVVVAELLLRGI